MPFLRTENISGTQPYHDSNIGAILFVGQVYPSESNVYLLNPNVQNRKRTFLCRYIDN